MQNQPSQNPRKIERDPQLDHPKFDQIRLNSTKKIYLERELESVDPAPGCTGRMLWRVNGDWVVRRRDTTEAALSVAYSRQGTRGTI
jgi:hypothetical protein